MAEKGYLTIAFDPSFTGKMEAIQDTWLPDINTEDFMAAVDSFSVREEVDQDRIESLSLWLGWDGFLNSCT